MTSTSSSQATVTSTDGFCLAPWLTATISLASEKTACCQWHVSHEINTSQASLDPTAIHNTIQKKSLRKKMLNSEFPNECDTCWQFEKQHPENLSPRQIQNQKLDTQLHQTLLNSTGEENINLLELKIQFTPDDAPPSLSQSMLREAFWRWWPELSTTLRSLHITDSLSSKDFWTLFDDFGDQGSSERINLTIEDHFKYPENVIEKFIEKTYYTQSLSIIAQPFKPSSVSLFSASEFHQWIKQIHKILIYAKIKSFTIQLDRSLHQHLVQLDLLPHLEQLQTQFAEKYLLIEVMDKTHTFRHCRK